MENRRAIENLDQLRQEIARVRADYQFQEIHLKNDAKIYLKQFSPMNLIKKVLKPDNLKSIDGQTNISGTIMAVVLPFLMNKTLFRGSGFITKAVGALITGKIGKSLDAAHIKSAFNSVKSLFSSKDKVKVAKFDDYGIPPDSETY